MSFGENVIFYRKQQKITQEELAERLFVSRQTVSRWENDSTLPDVETLVRLCEVFNCDMDTLVRKDAKETAAEKSKFKKTLENRSLYDRHMNIFAALISSGVALILLGIVILVFLGAFPSAEMFSVILLLSLIAVSVAMFVFGGINHTNFMRENPHVGSYSESEIRTFSKKLPWFISLATILIFLGIIFLVITNYSDDMIPEKIEKSQWEHFTVAIFLLLLSLAVFIYVYTGIIHSKYDVKSYNESCVKEGFAPGEKSERENKGKTISDAVCGVIMLVATAAFLLLGFLKNAWHPAWILFPVGGICCGICSIIFDAIFKDKKDN